MTSRFGWLYVHISSSDKRYTCSHLHCLPGPGKDLVYFGTWTALQVHIRKDHPPTCTHPKCDGRTFASQYNLRAHQKLHEQQEAEAQLYRADRADAPEDGTDVEGSQPRKRRRGGELGRDWICDFAGCDKDFKSVCSASHALVVLYGLLSWYRKARSRRTTTSSISVNGITCVPTYTVTAPLDTNYSWSVI